MAVAPRPPTRRGSAPLARSLPHPSPTSSSTAPGSGHRRPRAPPVWLSVLLDPTPRSSPRSPPPASPPTPSPYRVTRAACRRPSVPDVEDAGSPIHEIKRKVVLCIYPKMNNQAVILLEHLLVHLTLYTEKAASKSICCYPWLYVSCYTVG
ncbi:proline-rich receptor-like protein kinase PERK2 isoform X2 [Miscanthus floridulus]|uniref:proline-rich receptor-like protein kinase PERK2 isoform X2 n=1 Tax=Miscanthus floridulus TaxID=154761 RepID=UPI00345A5BB5